MRDHVKRELPSVASSAAVARQAVAEALRLAGFHGDVDAAVLLTSELVTNAIRHAQPPLAIEVVADATVATAMAEEADARKAATATAMEIATAIKAAEAAAGFSAKAWPQK